MKALTKTKARKMLGGLSNPGKMPGRAWSVPVSLCNMGAKFAKSKNSVCHDTKCYFKLGQNAFPNSIKAHWNRFNAWKDMRSTINGNEWVSTMTTAIGNAVDTAHRWFDGGDLYNGDMLDDIVEVCKQTDKVIHYLPTKEMGVLKAHKDAYPTNLMIRYSLPMIDQKPSKSHWKLTEKKNVGLARTFQYEWPTEGSVCPSEAQGGECKSCRMCWDDTIDMISYPYHKGTHHTPSTKDRHDAYLIKMGITT